MRFNASSERAILACAMAAAFGLGVAGINSYLPGGGDNADYIAEAEAVLTRGTRVLIHTQGDPPAFRPPLFSWMLACVEVVCGRNVAAMKALLVFCAALSVFAAWWAIKTGLRDSKNPAAEEAGKTAAGVALWFALAPTLLRTSHDILSDVPFTVLALVAVALAGRSAQNRTSHWSLIALVAVLVVGTLCRAAGVFIAGGCAIYFIVEAWAQRREPGYKRLLFAAALMLALSAGLFAYTRSISGTYVGMLESGSAQGATADVSGSLIERLMRSAKYYLTFLPGEVAAYPGFGPYYPLPILGILVASAGTVSFVRRGLWLIPTVFLVYQAGLVLWPGVEPRLYLPTLPLFLALFFEGGRWMLERSAGFAAGVSAAAAFVLALCPAVSLTSVAFSWMNPQAEGTVDLDWIVASVWLALLIAGTVWKVKRMSPGEPIWRPQLALVMCIFLALGAVRSLRENVLDERAARPAPSGPGWKEMHVAAEWLKANGKPGDAVLSSKVSLVWFWSGMQGVQIPRTANLLEGLKSMNGTRWAIVDVLEENRVAERFLKPLLAADAAHWKVRWAENGTVIYERVGE
ncbi:MAG: hypothetical protein HY291_16800 [Planctomycetes bacterium]|nr:hypothetical protein [Planctomycetota bacterium]